MSYTFDPVALHAVAQQAAGLQLPSDELITRTVELLAEQYPDLIVAGPGRWVGVLGRCSGMTRVCLVRSLRRSRLRNRASGM